MQNDNKIIKLNDNAINFHSECINAENNIEHINFAAKVKEKYAVLFFYPLNFTFVCPTEILALNAKLEEFYARGVEVFGISVDSLHCHLAWKNTKLEQGGIGNIDIPLISDIKKEISEGYNALNASSGLATRTTVIIDPDFKVIHIGQYVNHIGRNIDDYLRIIDADMHFKMYGEVCPANWSKNSTAIKPDLASTAIYLVNLKK
ncbi:MAG: peroxiredoxin [Rickettsiales bacterium]